MTKKNDILTVAKTSQSDGLMIDAEGRLYFSGVTTDTVYFIDLIDRETGRFPKEQLEIEEMVSNTTSLSWVDTLSVDNFGQYLWATSRYVVVHSRPSYDENMQTMK